MLGPQAGKTLGLLLIIKREWYHQLKELSQPLVLIIKKKNSPGGVPEANSAAVK